ncbi:MAG: Ig-like domain-containing protein, partial [Deltaproteobacteria bacterium]|nr:Ig-like domain-containing protein [Deltaproteobacteria bacterium]
FATRVSATISYDPSTFTATLTPDGALDPLTAYTVTVTENVTNTIGDSLDREYTWLFVTRAGEILLYVEPDEDETDVSVAAHICGIFTEDVDPTTVDEDSFFATFEDQWGRTEEITGSYTFVTLPSGAGKLCLVPEPDEYDCLWDRGLLYDTLYTATITTDVELDNDAAPPDTLTADFTWSFETTSEPQILSLVPEDGEKDVPIVLSPLVAVLDRPVDEDTVTSLTVLLDEVGGPSISGMVSLADDGFTLQFEPDANLDFDTEHVFTIVSGLDGVRDTERNYLLEDAVATFRTSPENAFVMVPNDPAIVVAGAEEGDAIELLFERALDPATVSAVNVEVYSDTLLKVINANFAYDFDTQTISITTIPEVENGDDYTVTVFPGLLDHLGNPFPVETAVSFEVTGSANNNPSIDFGRDGERGHDRYWIQGSDNLMITSVTPESLVFEDFDGDPVAYRVVAYDVTSDTLYIQPDDFLQWADGPYTLSVNEGVTDLQRNPASFNTEDFAIEGDAPTVVDHAPVGTAVPGHAVVQVTFNERMDKASFAGDAFELEQGSTPITGDGKLDPTGTIYSFRPEGFLDAGLVYTARVNATATDTAGNGASTYEWTFTVESTPPTIVFPVPTEPPSDVPLDSDVTVTFDEPMDKAAFSESVVGSDGTIRLIYDTTADAYVCIDVDGADVVLDPVDPLEAATTYTISVDATVFDTAGNAMGSPFTSEFTTQ